MKCEGCGRNWSSNHDGSPFPSACPECGHELSVEPLPFEPTKEEAEEAPRHKHSYRQDGTCACGAVHPLHRL